MTATTGTDINGVEYYFDETSGNPGGSDSGWQSSSSYTDSGLSESTQYCYRVQLRDQSAYQNTGSWSTTECATTQAGGGTWTKVDDRHASVTRYGSGWELWDGVGVAYQQTVSAAIGSGDYAIFSFNGTKARLYGYKYQYGSNANIYIDGSPDGSVSFYNASEQGDVLMYESDTLSSGPHELKVEWVGSGDVTPDAFGYFSN